MTVIYIYGLCNVVSVMLSCGRPAKVHYGSSLFVHLSSSLAWASKSKTERWWKSNIGVRIYQGSSNRCTIFYLKGQR